MRPCVSAVLVGCVVLAAAALCAGASEAGGDVEVDHEPQTLRIMSFNIRYGAARDGENHWDRRRDFVVETIRNFGPDLLGTQECLAFQAEFLRERLAGYAFHGAGRDDGAQRGEMVAIFWRAERFELLDAGHFWLSETPDVPGSRSWDAAITRMVSWVKLRPRGQEEGPHDDVRRPIWFFNTHFDHRGREARLESSRLLRRRALELAGDDPIIIAGDFNAPVDTESQGPYRALLIGDGDEPGGPHFIDTYLAAGLDEPEQGTFHAFRGTTTGPRIDWIIVSPHFETIEAAIDRTSRDGRYPSDHFPITAVVRLSGGS